MNGIPHSDPYMKPEHYQFASGLIPQGRIKTQSRGFRLLYWLLKPAKK